MTTEKVFVDHWGTFVTTPVVTEKSATVNVKTRVMNALQQDQPVTLRTTIIDKNDKNVATTESNAIIPKGLALRV